LAIELTIVDCELLRGDDITAFRYLDDGPRSCAIVGENSVAAGPSVEEPRAIAGRNCRLRSRRAKHRRGRRSPLHRETTGARVVGWRSESSWLVLVLVRRRPAVSPLAPSGGTSRDFAAKRTGRCQQPRRRARRGPRAVEQHPDGTVGAALVRVRAWDEKLVPIRRVGIKLEHGELEIGEPRWPGLPAKPPRCRWYLASSVAR